VARELGLSEQDIDLTGPVDDTTLRKTLASASAFVFPSRVEGFGLPILEAMALGVPTMIARVEPMRSIAGGAALEFAPDSSAELAEQLVRVLGNAELAADLRARGRARAETFRWEDTALATLRVYEEVLSSRPSRRGRGS